MTEVIRVFDRACDNQVGKLFDELESENPYSYAVRLHRRASSTRLAERMHASIMGIIAANLLPIGFRGARPPTRARAASISAIWGANAARCSSPSTTWTPACAR